MPRVTNRRRLLLGQRIKELRASRHLSQEKLAERAGVNVTYLSSVERGNENPTVEMLEKLADGLDVELFDLFNVTWLGMSERELKKKLKTMVDASDLDGLREVLAMIAARRL